MLTVTATLSAIASSGLLPRMPRHHSLVLSVHHDVVVCAAWSNVAAAVSNWIVVATPGLTVKLPLGAAPPLIGEWWRPSSAPTAMLTELAMLIVNWPLLSVVTAPMPGTVSCRPGSGTLTSPEKPSLPVRVQPRTVTVVSTGGADTAAALLAVAAPAWLAWPQSAKPHSCLSLTKRSTAPVRAST